MEPVGRQTGNKTDSLPYDTTKTAVITWNRGFPYPFESTGHQPAILTPDDMKQVETAFISCVTDYNKALPNGQEAYKIDWVATEYSKQLVAVTNSNLEKIVWVNCFCGNLNEQLKTQILIVHDGGPCYFNFKINLTTGKYYDLLVNGFG